MTPIGSVAEIEQTVATHPFVLIYFSRRGCGVCADLKPRVEALGRRFLSLVIREIDLDDHPEAAGSYSIFTIPGILVFVDGRESIREARFVSIDKLATRMERLYDLRFAS